MKIELSDDYELQVHDSGEFYTCNKRVFPGEVISISINEFSGKVSLTEYCLTVPPYWGEIVDCKDLKKTVRLTIESDENFEFGVRIPSRLKHNDVFGLTIKDNESMSSDIRFKIRKKNSVTPLLDKLTWGDKLVIKSAKSHKVK